VIEKMLQNDLPLIIFDGNCQSQHLSAIFSASGVAETLCLGGDLGFVPSFNGVRANYASEGEILTRIKQVRAEGRSVLQASQSTQMAPNSVRSYTEHTDRVIRFPHLQFYAMSPQRFKETFRSSLAPIRANELDLRTIEICEKRAEVEPIFSEFIREHHKHKPLFHTVLHPGGELTARLVEILAKQISENAVAKTQPSQKQLSATEGMNFITDHPVSDDVLETLGFDWGASYQLYKRALEASSQGNFQFLLDNRLELQNKFPNDFQIIFALATATTMTNKIVEAENLIKICLKKEPGFIYSWNLAFDFATIYHKIDLLEEFIAQAKQFFGDQRQGSHVLSLLYLKLKKYEQAEIYARDYHARTPDRTDSLYPILRVFAETGRENTAREWALNDAANRDAAGKSQTLSIVQRIPELAQINISF
jgi:hypothetical protein